MRKIGVHPSLQLTCALANREAHSSGSALIEPIHFFLACLLIIDDCFHEQGNALGFPHEEIRKIVDTAGEALRASGLTGEVVTVLRRELTKTLRQRDVVSEPVMLHRSEESRALFHDAIADASRTGAEAVSMKHLFDVLLDRLPDKPSALGRMHADALIHSLGFRPEKTLGTTPQRAGGPPNSPLLDALGRDLTGLARADLLPPVVGRKKEITAIARYLQRTTKRNVLIVGEAGVGKTAVVEGLAQKIAKKEVPLFLQSLRIVQVNISDLVAGTSYRGEMEKRMKSMIAEATNDPNLILFIDEIHLAVRAGTGNGSPMDISSMLKPALSRDDFRCIGATTFDEYERYIKPDGALRRRFQMIRIGEPDRDESVRICMEWARRIEDRQQVVIAEESVRAAVDLSLELIRGRFLPDKAIDLLENAAVLVKVSTLSEHGALPSKETPTVQVQHIKAVLEEQFGISADMSGTMDLKGVEAHLRSEIVGQESAIRLILQELRAVLTRRERRQGPLSVLLLTGPTGTGKTLAADTLGRALFEKKPEAVGRFNMNEFKERHELARLIGAPPGFIGHEQPGPLFRFAETNPQGVIILDEMEKAHPEIKDYFLEIFDRGEARDAKGRMVDFRPYLFILACNIPGRRELPGPIGFTSAREADAASHDRNADDTLHRYFRREFLARISRIVEFGDLVLSDYLTILERRLLVLSRDIQEEFKGVVQMTDAAKGQFAGRCVEQPDGGRGFGRLFDQLIAMPLRECATRRPEKRIQLKGFVGNEPVLEVEEEN